MPVCRRLKPVRVYFWLLLSLLSLSPHASADGVDVNAASIQKINGIYTLQAQLIYQLSDKAIEALTHGVPLSFVVSARINRQRDYLWDVTIYRSRQTYRLEYHALTEQYRVTNQITGQRRIFFSLAGATQHLGDITMPLGEDLNHQYADPLIAELQAELDIEALPAPLRPVAYLSPQWHISSPVHRLRLPQ